MHRSDLRRDMIALDLPRLLLITLFIVALTSSARPDDLDKDDKPVGSNLSMIVYSDAINDKKESEWAEGGSISASSIRHENMMINSTVATVSDKPKESRTRENVPKEKNASVVPKKEADLKKRVHARKGVDLGILNHTSSEHAKSIEISSATEAAHTNNQIETSNINISKLDASSSYSNDSLNSNYSSTSVPINVTTSHAKMTVIHNTTTTTPKTSSHIPKPKPTVTTVDGPEVSESRPSSRTKSSSLGMPRKIDYIAPVIITIIALPILGAVIFMLYRRGRDCWDKRHYRRMDFLIDGMYND